MEQDLKNRIRAQAREAGFDTIAFTVPDHESQSGPHLMTYLAEGRHGSMGWMKDHADRRASPTALWPDVRSIIMLGTNYGPESDPLANLKLKDKATISVYARNRDYHDLIKKRLKRVARDLVATTGADVKVFVDTAPVMEKPLSEQAGLGWQGKHTNLVSREFGSWLFLGSIFTTAEIKPDRKEQDLCGNCRECLDICPTNAFPAPYQLDARRCISYLTIEYKGHIAEEFRASMGNRIYGCDDCLAVCPWNKFAQLTEEPKFLPRDALDAPALETLVRLDDAAFREFFSGSPIKRTGRDRFVRNVLIAIANSENRELAKEARVLLEDQSPLVRAMAIWACYRLYSDVEFSQLREEYADLETEPDVAREWRMKEMV